MVRNTRTEAQAECKRQKIVKEAKADYIKQAVAVSTAEVVLLEHDLAQAQLALNDALGEGIAHLGDIIGVSPEIFRRRSEAAVDSWHAPNGNPLLAEALSAQAVDGICGDGKMRPTPFSFGNGSSGQCLLKDFRNCASHVCAVSLHSTLAGTACAKSGVTGLNWDPASQRAYALQWEDPATGGTADPVVNALAFVGLSFMTLVPVGRGTAAIGWGEANDGFGFVWPIWTVPLSLPVVRSLVAAPKSVQSSSSIAIRYFSRCINPTGKRNFFAPAKPF